MQVFVLATMLTKAEAGRLANFVILLDIISFKKEKKEMLPDFAERIKDKLAAVNMTASYDKVPYQPINYYLYVALAFSGILFLTWHRRRSEKGTASGSTSSLCQRTKVSDMSE